MLPARGGPRGRAQPIHSTEGETGLMQVLESLNMTVLAGIALTVVLAIVLSAVAGGGAG